MANHYSKNLRLPFADVVNKMHERLQEQGFHSIHIFDMRKNLKINLDVRFRNYKILTACHSLLSYKAMSLEPRIGVLLTCNIVIQEHENGVVEITAINPLEAMDQNMSTPSLEEVALEMSNHLRTAVDFLAKHETYSFSYN